MNNVESITQPKCVPGVTTQPTKMAPVSDTLLLYSSVKSTSYFPFTP